MFEWVQLNLDKGVVEINAQINDFEGPLQCSPTKRRCHPSVRNKASTTTNERATEPPIKMRAAPIRESHPQVRKGEAPNVREKVEMMMTV